MAEVTGKALLDLETVWQGDELPIRKADSYYSCVPYHFLAAIIVGSRPYPGSKKRLIAMAF